MTAMNYSSAIFLIDKTVRAVKVSYEQDGNGKPSGALTTFKTFDHSIQPEDFVIVPTDTRWKMTACRVEEVDVEVDLDSTVQLQFLVGTIDRTAYENIVAREKAAIVTIKSAEKRRKQEELVAALMKDNPEIQALANVGAGLTLAAPPAPPAYEPEVAYEAPPKSIPGDDQPF